MGPIEARALAGLSDGELITMLRDGDDDAYEELWSRHIAAAIRVAERALPHRAEDLASEAFLAVRDQIALVGGGPTEHFRAYLFTTIRNLAARSRLEEATSAPLPDALSTAEDPTWASLERDDDARAILDSFHAIPGRWQQVLWLMEVEGVERREAARRLGIRPNAVSALVRRARHGLRLQWLERLVPSRLAGIDGHIADRLPAAVLDSLGDALPAEVAAHVRECSACADVHAELMSARDSMRGRTLAAVGFAALGVTLPAAGSTWVAPAVLSAAAAASLLAIGVGTVALVSTLGIVTPAAQPPITVVEETATPDVTDAPITPPIDAGDVHVEEESTSEEPTQVVVAPTPSASPQPSTPPTAPEVESITFDVDESEGDYQWPTSPERPDTVTPPADDTSTSTVAAPTLTSMPAARSAYFPMLAGSSEPDSAVLVEVDDAVYRATSQPDGTWSFDVSRLLLPGGTYEASIWAVVDDTASTAVPVAFTVDELAVSGLDEFHVIDLGTATREGIIVHFEGPPSAAVCLSAGMGDSFTVQLDADGVAERRILLLGYGYYPLEISVCGDGELGATTGAMIQVVEGVFDPYVEGDPEMIVEEVTPTPSP